MRTACAGLILATLQPAAPPPSDIYLVSLTVKGEVLTLSEPKNISNSPGYDNQPHFTPDGRGVLFTSARSTGKADAAPAPQTDIYRYDVPTQALRQVTATPESEYSPTVTPDGKGISVIRVEADGTQRLWRFALEGQSPAVILTDVKPVGYHAWIDEHRLALFILGGDGQPATLQLADTRTGKTEVIASDIGRSILRMPSGRISFVQRRESPEGSPRLVVRQFDPGATGEGRLSDLVEAPEGLAQPDLAWLPDGSLLVAHAGRLHRWRPGSSGWSAAANLEALGLKGVTRLAVNPSGDQLALVADRH